MLVSVTAITYLTCAIAHFLAALLLLISPAQHRYKALLLAATVTTAIWGLTIAARQLGLPALDVSGTFALILEQLRNIGWLAVMIYILFGAYKKLIDPAVGFAFAVITLACMCYVMWQAISGIADGSGYPATRSGVIASILVVTSGLVMVENLFRNAGRETRWALKYLCFALGGMFGYDLLLYGEGALFGRVNLNLYAARGVVDAMMAPFVIMAAARSKKWPIDLHVSRRIVYHSATIMIAGVYLVGISAVGYFLRLLDSPWGMIARISFAAAAILLLVVIMSSASVQARIKNFVNRNFFSYKYDYRQEWPNFIAAISGNLTEISIPVRIVRALANILEATAGAIWVHIEEDGVYRLNGSWNIDGLPPNVSAQNPLVRTLAGMQSVIDIEHGTAGTEALPANSLPAWLMEDRRTWLIVPLTHMEGLLGFVVLGRPRAPRDLNWEDFDLLNTAGRQAASYIAEEEASRSLAKARRFEDFNRQFAFVVHDIKNLAGQMSLILTNAERHGSNPQFQNDVLATVADSLKRMHSLLDQLKQRKVANVPIKRVDLVDTIRKFAERWQLQISGLQVDLPVRSIEIVAEPQQIEAVLNHLVQNAAEAAGRDGRVTIRMYVDELAESPEREKSPDNGYVAIEIADNGPGMDRQFIEEKLFQPLDTTKRSGFGIGAYQALYLVRDMGGHLDVQSEIGHGTQMTVRLPIAPPLVVSPGSGEFSSASRQLT